MTDEELLDEYCISFFGHLKESEDGRKWVRDTLGFKRHVLSVRLDEFETTVINELKKIIFWR